MTPLEPGIILDYLKGYHMSIRYDRNTDQWAILVRLENEAIIVSRCQTLTEAIKLLSSWEN
jgi:hypothetical protein